MKGIKGLFVIRVLYRTFSVRTEIRLQVATVTVEIERPLNQGDVFEGLLDVQFFFFFYLLSKGGGSVNDPFVKDFYIF